MRAILCTICDQKLFFCSKVLATTQQYIVAMCIDPLYSDRDANRDCLDASISVKDFLLQVKVIPRSVRLVQNLVNPVFSYCWSISQFVPRQGIAHCF